MVPAPHGVTYGASADGRGDERELEDPVQQALSETTEVDLLTGEASPRTCHSRRPSGLVSLLPADAAALSRGGVRTNARYGPCRTPFGAAADDSPASAPEAGEAVDSASLHKFWHRAGWLVALLLFQSTSSVILERFEALIKAHPVVIYFLTMLVGAGGNAGGQSTVLVVRKLALAAVRDGKAGERVSMRRIVGPEVAVGLKLAVVLFAASVVRCLLFQVRGAECLAICLSMLAIVFMSTLVGSALPVLLHRVGVDAAHAGAAIQVIMDIGGVTITCVVSCLVLGVPLTEGAAALPHVGSLTASRHALSSFGGSEATPGGQLTRVASVGR